MKIIKKIYQSVKREIHMYLIFRRLSHGQIEAMRRQAELIKAAKAPKPEPPPPTPKRFETWHDSLEILRTAVMP